MNLRNDCLRPMVYYERLGLTKYKEKQELFVEPFQGSCQASRAIRYRESVSKATRKMTRDA
uniref:Uncharacterized protein n=1 Tax=viral metagenome TaxID=1070528 RepID=A0A6C0DDL6_9ZZZZ